MYILHVDVLYISGPFKKNIKKIKLDTLLYISLSKKNKKKYKGYTISCRQQRHLIGRPNSV